MYIGYHHNLLFIVCKMSANSITDRNDQLTAHALKKKAIVFIHTPLYLSSTNNILHNF